MKKMLLLAACVAFGFAMVASASTLITVESGICTAVENRQGIGFAEGFDKNIGKLYCFTKLTAPDQKEAAPHIVHVWYHKDVERFRITLPVRGATWVTHSEKNILPTETGDWRVDVLGSGGERISVFQFFIKE